MSANIAKGALYWEVHFDNNQSTRNPRVIYIGKKVKDWDSSHFLLKLSLAYDYFFCWVPRKVSQ